MGAFVIIKQTRQEAVLSKGELWYLLNQTGHEADHSKGDLFQRMQTRHEADQCKGELFKGKADEA